MLTNTIADRIAQAGLDPTDVAIDDLSTYFLLLAKWNRHINLTALPVDPPGVEAIDRLLVEPVVAARYLENPTASVVDLGSGGGSPAIPFKIQQRRAALTMVESRTKKCAFLREAVRTIGLDGAKVEESRFESLVVAPEVESMADVITLRAVRMDELTARLIRWVARPRALLLRFVSANEQGWEGDVAGITLVAEHPLVASTSSSIQLFHVEH